MLLQLLHVPASLRQGLEDEEPRWVHVALLAALLHGPPQELGDRLGVHPRHGVQPVDGVLQLPASAHLAVVIKPLQANSEVLLPESDVGAVVLVSEDGSLVGIRLPRPNVPVLPQLLLALMDEALPPRQPVVPGEVEASAGAGGAPRRRATDQRALRSRAKGGGPQQRHARSGSWPVAGNRREGHGQHRSTAPPQRDTARVENAA
mmetsp:Transcript_4460/g.12610  ORF Transcript_4460/g.12610 Transcript_4460/m.12610 type:complete len:205 (+) Transcript_4460:465-1079(+)